MSRIDNEFRLSGRMGGPVEVTYNPNNGNPIGNVSLAVNASYTDRQTGELVERPPNWMPLTFYSEKHVKRLQEMGGKGRELHVMGVLGKDVWDSTTRTKEDGTPAKDSRVTLTVTSLWFGLEPRGGGEQPAGAADDGQG